MSSQQTTTREKSLIFYFQVHQPRRLRTLRFFDIGRNRGYFDDDLNKQIVQRIAANCYIPANTLLLKLIKKHPSIKVAFSISGITIDQLEEYAPEALDSFRALAATGCVEFLAETYYHSLACLIPGNEFESQVVKHQQKILKHVGVLPKFFRNTELVYSKDLGERIAQMGFNGVFIDGIDRMLGTLSAHHVYRNAGTERLPMLLRDYRLSDEISFRFSDGPSPLTAEQYIKWLEAIPATEDVVSLAMDYETFGEHQKKENGIFNFMETLLKALAVHKQFRLRTPSEAVEEIAPVQTLSVPGFISWADDERDLSAWLGNEMQRDAFDSLLKIEADVKTLNDTALLREWRTLQTSDHFYYMSTKKGDDGGVHAYFSPYPSPYEAFINYMNVLTDFGLRVKISKSAAAVLAKKTQVEQESEELVPAYEA